MGKISKNIRSTFIRHLVMIPSTIFIRYGTHFVKSAKFGGKLNIFKSSSKSSGMSQEQFAETAETEFSSMMSTLKNSFQQTEARAGMVAAFSFEAFHKIEQILRGCTGVPCNVITLL